jgi:hypothetical protein
LRYAGAAHRGPAHDRHRSKSTASGGRERHQEAWRLCHFRRRDEPQEPRAAGDPAPLAGGADSRGFPWAHRAQPDQQDRTGPLSHALCRGDSARGARRIFRSRSPGRREHRKAGHHRRQYRGGFRREAHPGRAALGRARQLRRFLVLPDQLWLRPRGLDGDQRHRRREPRFRSLSLHPAEPRPVLHRCDPGADHHDEPAPPGAEGPAALLQRLSGQSQGRASKSAISTRRSTTSSPGSGSAWPRSSRSSWRCCRSSARRRGGRLLPKSRSENRKARLRRRRLRSEIC